ncbi:hypothetical protein FKM82_010378 [Ascaphus truei]|uniref:uncharacterized protein LOC142492863 n=1 Tax=Ascaphus truei TaxID=8439 RepID=UPI003F5A5D64
MGLETIWKNYKVLIVMGTGLGLIHWGWYHVKINPIFHPNRKDFVPEPGIVSYVIQQDRDTKAK